MFLNLEKAPVHLKIAWKTTTSCLKLLLGRKKVSYKGLERHESESMIYINFILG